MSAERYVSGVRVTVDPHMLAWAVTSASLFAMEFDEDLQRLRLEHELEWGVPLRITVAHDRMIVEAEAGEDLAMKEGLLFGNGEEQPLQLRYTIPASVTGSLPTGAETWVIPADELRESLHTATRKRANELGYFWREVSEKDITLRMVTPKMYYEEHLAEKRRDDPSYQISFERFIEQQADDDIPESAPRLTTGRMLIASTPGRSDYFCSVLGCEQVRLGRGALAGRRIEGDAVELDLKRALAIGYASQTGEGVLIDVPNGRLAAPTEDGLFACATTKAAEDRAPWSAPARDVDLAEALSSAPAEVRAEIRRIGEAMIGLALSEDEPEARVRALTHDLDAYGLERLSGLVHSIRSEPMLSSAKIQDAKDLIGRVHVEQRARQVAGMPAPLHTLSEGGRAAVVSPRMMFATAFSSLSAEDRYKEIAKAEAMRRSRIIHIAAAASAADLDVRFREELARNEMLVAIGKARNDDPSHVSLAARIVEGIDDVGRRAMREAALDWLDDASVSQESIADRIAVMEAQTGGDLVVAGIAAAFSLAENAKEFDRHLAGVAGRVRIEGDVRKRQLESAKEDISPGEIEVGGYEFVTAHMMRSGRRSVFEADVRRALGSFAIDNDIPLEMAERIQASSGSVAWSKWAEGFMQSLKFSDRHGENIAVMEAIRQAWAIEVANEIGRPGGERVRDALGLDPKADLTNPSVRDALGPRLYCAIRPDAKTLDFNQTRAVYLGGVFKEDRSGVSFPLAERRAVTGGRIAVDDQHRVHFSITSPDGRWGVSVVDRAKEPRPEMFARQHGLGTGPRNMIRDLLDGKHDIARFSVPSEDLVRVVGLVADAGDSRRGSPRVLVVARWDGLDAGEGPALDVAHRDHDRSVEGYPLPRTSRPDAQMVGGSLRFYIFGDEGVESVDLPITEARGLAVSHEDLRKQSLSVAVDAGQLHDLAGFAAESGSAVPIGLREDGSLVFRSGNNSIAVLAPAAGRERVPQHQRDMIDLVQGRALVRTEADMGEPQELDSVIAAGAEVEAVEPAAFDPGNVSAIEPMDLPLFAGWGTSLEDEVQEFAGIALSPTEEAPSAGVDGATDTVVEITVSEPAVDAVAAIDGADDPSSELDSDWIGNEGYGDVDADLEVLQDTDEYRHDEIDEQVQIEVMVRSSGEYQRMMIIARFHRYIEDNVRLYVQPVFRGKFEEKFAIAVADLESLEDSVLLDEVERKVWWDRVRNRVRDFALRRVKRMVHQGLLDAVPESPTVKKRRERREERERLRQAAQQAQQSLGFFDEVPGVKPEEKPLDTPIAKPEPAPAAGKQLGFL